MSTFQQPPSWHPPPPPLVSGGNKHPMAPVLQLAHVLGLCGIQTNRLILRAFFALLKGAVLAICCSLMFLGESN